MSLGNLARGFTLIEKPDGSHAKLCTRYSLTSPRDSVPANEQKTYNVKSREHDRVDNSGYEMYFYDNENTFRFSR